VVLFAIVGVGNVLVDVSTYSALPRAVPDRVLAKVFGLLEALLQIGMALGAVVAGVLLHAFSARITLLVVVCCCRSSRSPQLRCFAASMPDSHTTIWKLTCCDASRCSKTCQCLFSTTSAHASFPPISAPAT
jgi:MFS family permease